MKTIFVAAVAEESRESKKKLYAYMIPIKIGANLRAALDSHKCEVLHLCESRKQAAELVEDWNLQFKRNGTYMFSEEW